MTPDATRPLGQRQEERGEVAKALRREGRDGAAARIEAGPGEALAPLGGGWPHGLEEGLWAAATRLLLEDAPGGIALLGYGNGTWLRVGTERGAAWIRIGPHGDVVEWSGEGAAWLWAWTPGAWTLAVAGRRREGLQEVMAQCTAGRGGGAGAAEARAVLGEALHETGPRLAHYTVRALLAGGRNAAWIRSCAGRAAPLGVRIAVDTGREKGADARRRLEGRPWAMMDVMAAGLGPGHAAGLLEQAGTKAGGIEAAGREYREALQQRGAGAVRRKAEGAARAAVGSVWCRTAAQRRAARAAARGEAGHAACAAAPTRAAWALREDPKDLVDRIRALEATRSAMHAEAPRDHAGGDGTGLEALWLARAAQAQRRSARPARGWRPWPGLAAAVSRLAADVVDTEVRESRTLGVARVLWPCPSRALAWWWTALELLGTRGGWGRLCAVEEAVERHARARAAGLEGAGRAWTPCPAWERLAAGERAGVEVLSDWAAVIAEGGRMRHCAWALAGDACAGRVEIAHLAGEHGWKGSTLVLRWSGRRPAMQAHQGAFKRLPEGHHGRAVRLLEALGRAAGEVPEERWQSWLADVAARRAQVEGGRKDGCGREERALRVETWDATYGQAGRRLARLRRWVEDPEEAIAAALAAHGPVGLERAWSVARDGTGRTGRGMEWIVGGREAG